MSEQIDGDDAVASVDGGTPGEAGARPRRRSRGNRAWQEDQPPEVIAQGLKERVYATFTGLAIVLVLRGHETTARDAVFALVIGVLGITVAGFAADVISHLAVHASLPSGHEFRRMTFIAGGAFSSAAVPIGLLLSAWAGWLNLDGALGGAMIVYLATLGVIGFAAVRRAALTWLQKLVVLLALVLLGGLVIVLQLLAHG